MPRVVRSLFKPTGLALVLVGLLTACGSGEQAAGRAEPNGQVETLTAEIKVGEVVPNAEEIEVTAGTTIKITASSQIKDELHVHGYDKSLELRPGQEATLEFLADTTGTFDIESHATDLLIYQLVVQP